MELRPDTRTWNNATYASYMRGRRGDLPPLTITPSAEAFKLFASIVAIRLEQTDGNIPYAVHAALTQVGVEDAAALGFSLMRSGGYRCTIERKFENGKSSLTIDVGGIVGPP